MIEIILLIIASAAIGVIFKDQITIKNDWLERIGFGADRKIHSSKKWVDYILKLIHKFLNCYCLSFWVCWIITGSIMYGFIAYVLAALIYKELNTFQF